MILNTDKARIQKRGFDKLWKHNFCGTLEMCTGSGKSRIAVLVAKHIVQKVPDAKILLLVPRENLRDNTWREEFTKWELLDVYENNVTSECYQTAYKWRNTQWTLVIADEIHNSLTENYGEFYKYNMYDHIVGLSATISVKKIPLLREIGAQIVFTYSLEQGIEDKVVSPYRVIVIRHEMESKLRNYKAGNKKVSWYQPEAQAYEYWTKQYEKAEEDMKPLAMKRAALARSKVLYQLPSKIPVAKIILDYHIKKGDRVLIFSESTDILAGIVGKYCIHSKKSKAVNRAILDSFVKGEINYLGNARMLNEGENLPGLNVTILVSYNSSLLDLIQRVGRIVRYVPGKESIIYIFATKGTVEEKWLLSLQSVYRNRIVKYVESTDLIES